MRLWCDHDGRSVVDPDEPHTPGEPSLLHSVANGKEVPGGTAFLSRNPAVLDDVVADVRLSDPATLRNACGAARQYEHEWAAVPAPSRGQVLGAFGQAGAF